MARLITAGTATWATMATRAASDRRPEQHAVGHDDGPHPADPALGRVGVDRPPRRGVAGDDADGLVGVLVRPGRRSLRRPLRGAQRRVDGHRRVTLPGPTRAGFRHRTATSGGCRVAWRTLRPLPLLLVVALVTGALATVAPPTASGDDIAEVRARAQAATQDLADAEARLGEISEDISTTQHQTDVARQAIGGLRSQVQEIAVQQYIRPDGRVPDGRGPDPSGPGRRPGSHRHPRRHRRPRCLPGRPGGPGRGLGPPRGTAGRPDRCDRRPRGPPGRSPGRTGPTGGGRAPASGGRGGGSAPGGRARRGGCRGGATTLRRPTPATVAAVEGAARHPRAAAASPARCPAPRSWTRGAPRGLGTPTRAST